MEYGFSPSTVLERLQRFAGDMSILSLSILPMLIFLRKLRRKFAGSFAEHQKIRKRIAAEAIRAIDSGRAFACSEQSRHIGHLRICVHMHATHDVMRGRADFHRLAR